MTLKTNQLTTPTGEKWQVATLKKDNREFRGIATTVQNAINASFALLRQNKANRK